MCLIIVKPEADVISESMIRNAYDHNHNGFGMMWVEEGRVKHIKGLFVLEQILEKYREVQHKNVAMHFRFSTRGAISENNCHPFRVLSLEEHGRDLFMMHNGTMNIGPIRAGWSDTREFVERILRPRLLTEGIDNIKDLAFRTQMGDYVTKRNKLFFLDGDGWTGFVNKSEGHTLGDTWFSNVYSLKKKAKRAKATATTTTTENRIVRDFEQMELGITEQPAVRRSGYRGRLDPDDIDALQPIAGDKFQLWIDTGHNDGRYEVFSSNEVWEAKQERNRRAEEAKEMELKRARTERLNRARQAAADEYRGITDTVPTPASRDALRRHWRGIAVAELRAEPSTPLPPTGIYGEFGVGDDDERMTLIDKVLGDTEVEKFAFVKGEHLTLDEGDQLPRRVKVITERGTMTMVEYNGGNHWIATRHVTFVEEKKSASVVSTTPRAPHYKMAPKSIFNWTAEEQKKIDTIFKGERVVVEYHRMDEDHFRVVCRVTGKEAIASVHDLSKLPVVWDERVFEAFKNQVSPPPKKQSSASPKKKSSNYSSPMKPDEFLHQPAGLFALVPKFIFRYSPAEMALADQFSPGGSIIAKRGRSRGFGQYELICPLTGKIGSSGECHPRRLKMTGEYRDRLRRNLLSIQQAVAA